MEKTVFTVEIRKHHIEGYYANVLMHGDSPEDASECDSPEELGALLWEMGVNEIEFPGK